MGKKALGLILVLVFTFVTGSALPSAMSVTQHDKLTALKGLPFSALVFFEDRDAAHLFLGILMDQDEIAEDNLRLLFQLVSEKYIHPVALEVQVYTDLRTPGALASGEVVNVGRHPSTRSTGKKKVEVPGGAFYLRKETVELFRYNPNYPEPGMKTVILSGKE